MARLRSYSNDNSINGHDRLIGTDGGRIGNDGMIVSGTAGATKNFLLSDLATYLSGNINRTIYNSSVSNDGMPLDLRASTVHVILQGARLNLPTGEDLMDGIWVRISQLNTDADNRLFNVPRFMNTDIAVGTQEEADAGLIPEDQVDQHVLVIDDRSASFELIYVGRDQMGRTSEDEGFDEDTLIGWVIIGAN